MPIAKRNRLGRNPLKQSLVERVRTGRVVPVISQDAIADLVLTGRDKVIEGYAEYIEYPFGVSPDLSEMTKYKSISEDLDDYDLKYDFLNYIKNLIYYMAEDEKIDQELLDEVAEEADSLSVSKFASRLQYPRFERGQDDPLLILADLPLPVYLTTSPYTFLEAALTRAGKRPRSEYCRWHSYLGQTDDQPKPSPDAPLVFHLFGLDSHPSSLVLTEDDYLQFLVTVSQGEGTDHDSIPDVVRRAISESALVVLGFELASWSFRVLFWGLIKPATLRHKTHRGVACLQVEPSQVEKQYLQAYLKREVDFEIYWGEMDAYVRQLHRMWKQ